MLKIRLMRIGAKKRPFYRVVAVDERNKRTGAYIDLLGTYNPLTNPHEVKLNQVKIDEWIKKGAQMSDGFLRIIGKAPQRPARKPKKAQPEPKVEPKTPEAATPVEQEATISAEETAPENQAEQTTNEPETTVEPETEQPTTEETVTPSEVEESSEEVPQNDENK